MAGKTPNRSERASRWRHLVQGGFVLLWLSPFIRIHSVCGTVFHCYSCPLAAFACPIGVVATFSALHVVPFLAIGILAVFAAAFGAFVCGWMCPFGFLQDVLGKIPFPRLRLPRWSGWLRYAILASMVLAIPFFFGEEHPLFFCRLCPAGALEGAAPLMVQNALAGTGVSWPSTAKMVVTVLVVTAMFFSYRPWCRLFCPLGAIYGVANRASAIFLNVNRVACTSCGACARICKYGVDPVRDPHDSRCIRCLDCTRCPTAAIGVGAVVPGRQAAPPAGRPAPSQPAPVGQEP